MKKFLLSLALFFGVFLFSQKTILLNNSWRVTKVLFKNTEYAIPVPIISPEQHRNHTNFSNTGFETVLLNSINNSYINLDDSSFTITSGNATLSQSPNIDFDIFENHYENIFFNGAFNIPVNYSITEVSSGNYSLILSDANSGNKIYYQNIISPLDNLLVENSWSISNLKIGSQTYFPTLSQDKLKITNTNAIINYFNQLSGYISFENQNPQFSLSNSFVSMVDSFDASIAEFDGNYLENFWGIRIFNNPYFIAPNNPFTYHISSDGKTLTITNANGDIATYKKNILATNEFKTPSVKAFPTVVSDFLYLENLENISEIQIFDASGKLILKENNHGEKNISLDLKNLKTGAYFLKINSKQALKFIKK